MFKLLLFNNSKRLLLSTVAPVKKALVSNTFKDSDRIDALIVTFNQAVQEMKQFLQEKGYSRRHFFFNTETKNEAEVAKSFGKRSEDFKEFLLQNQKYMSEYDFSRSIVSLGAAYRWQDAETIFKSGSVKFPYCPDIYSAIMYAYGKVGQYSKALRVFEEVTGKGAHTNRKMFEALMEAYSVYAETKILTANSRDNFEGPNSNFNFAHTERTINEISIDPIMRLYHQMIKSKFTPSIASITRIIRLAGRLRLQNVIEDMQREIERFSLKFDSQCYEVLIFALMQCSRCTEAEDVLSKALAEFGYVSPDSSRLFNVMLLGYCRLQRPSEAKRLYTQFSNHNIEPNSSALAFLVGTAAKCGFIRDAESFYSKLKQISGISEVLLIPAANHLLAAYLKDDNFESFYSLVDEISSSHRDHYTSTMLFDALSRSPDPVRLKQELSNIKSKLNHKNLSYLELSSLFRCLFLNFEGGEESVIRLFLNRIHCARPVEDVSFQTILLDAFAKLGDWDRCLDIVKQILKSTENTCCDPAIFAKLLTAAGPIPERIELVLEWMDRVKCWRDPAVLTLAMELYFKADQYDTAKSLWLEISKRRNKARPFKMAISIMAQIILKDDGPTAALQHLSTYRNLWNNSSVATYIKSLRMEGQTDSQFIENFFFETAIKMNPPPSIDVCNELLTVSHKSRLLQRVSDWMCESGCHANVNTVNILLFDLKDEESFKISEKLLENVIKSGKKPSFELLLRMISGQLERSTELGDERHLNAESYSVLLIEKITKTNTNTSLNLKHSIDPSKLPAGLVDLFKMWLKYFLKHNQMDQMNSLRDEMQKLGLHVDEEIVKLYQQIK